MRELCLVPAFGTPRPGGLAAAVDTGLSHGQGSAAAVAQVGRRDGAGEVVKGDGGDRAEGYPAEHEVFGEPQGRVTDGDDDAGGDRDEVDRVGEIDPVLLPDLGAKQADHPVQHDGDAAEHAPRDGGYESAELGAQPED